MPSTHETKSRPRPRPREENSLHPFFEAAEVTGLAHDVMVEIFFWKELTCNEIWQCLEEERFINNTAVNKLKSNKVWQPLFEEFFPNEVLSSGNYYSAFKERYQSLLDAAKRSFKAIVSVKRLHTDREFVLEVVKAGQIGILNFAITLREDWEIVLEGLKHNPVTHQLLSPDEYNESNAHLPVHGHPVIQRTAAMRDDNERVQACDFHLRQLKEDGQTPHLVQEQASRPRPPARRTFASFFACNSNHDNTPAPSEQNPSPCLIS